jgi:hypothetical protein
VVSAADIVLDGVLLIREKVSAQTLPPGSRTALDHQEHTDERSERDRAFGNRAHRGSILTEEAHTEHCLITSQLLGAGGPADGNLRQEWILIDMSFALVEAGSAAVRPTPARSTRKEMQRDTMTAADRPRRACKYAELHGDVQPTATAIRRPNVLSLSCGEAQCAGGQSGTPLAATNKMSAGSVCKRRDAMHLGRKEGLQPRARRTARQQLL